MLGVHVSKTSKILDPSKYDARNTMLDAITQDCEELKLNCCQIFTHGPANSHINAMDYSAVENYCTINQITLFVHSAYMTTGIWNIKESNKSDPKSVYTINLLVSQFECCEKLNSKGLVIHTPKKEPGIIIEALKIVIPFIKEFKTPLIFEMTAVKPDPTKTYETPEKINNLNKLLHQEFPAYDNWGWCIDTCHLWSAGIEMNDVATVNKWLTTLDKPEKIKLFHLNGASISTFNTGKDNHKVAFGADDDIWNKIININTGYIKKKVKKSSIYTIVEFAKIHNISIICEINRGDYKEIEFSMKAIRRMFI